MPVLNAAVLVAAMLALIICCVPLQFACSCVTFGFGQSDFLDSLFLLFDTMHNIWKDQASAPPEESLEFFLQMLPLEK